MARHQYPVRSHITMNGEEYPVGSAIVMEEKAAQRIPWAVDLSGGYPEGETPPWAKAEPAKAKAKGK